MVEDLKNEMRKLENLIGCQEKVDATSKSFTDELIRSLLSRYESDLEDTLRLHRLELFYDLIEHGRKKEQKSVDVEEKFVMSKETNDAEEDDEENEEMEKSSEDVKGSLSQEDVVTVRAEDVDNWKDLMTLQKVYYVLEHPNSQGLTWKRRVSKKKLISKYSDKDLIEWKVAQLFRLRSLEEWAQSRREARILADKSPYDFEDIVEDIESRELEDMFQILETQKQKKSEMNKLRKILITKRPFKFQDESMEDWAESYSEDSEESGANEIDEEVFEIPEEADFEVGEVVDISKESEFNEEASISEIFSSYKELPPYKNFLFEELKKTQTMKEWYDLCPKVHDQDAEKVKKRKTLPKFIFTIDEIDEDSIARKDTFEEDIPESLLITHDIGAKEIFQDKHFRKPEIESLEHKGIEAEARNIIDKILTDIQQLEQVDSYEKDISKQKRKDLSIDEKDKIFVEEKDIAQNGQLDDGEYIVTDSMIQQKYLDEITTEVKNTLEKVLMDVQQMQNVSYNEISKEEVGKNEDKDVKVVDQEHIIADKANVFQKMQQKKTDEDTFAKIENEEFVNLTGKISLDSSEWFDAEENEEISNLLPKILKEPEENENVHDAAEVLSEKSKRHSIEDTLQQTEVSEMGKNKKETDSENESIEELTDEFGRIQTIPVNKDNATSGVATTIESLEEMQKEKKKSIAQKPFTDEIYLLQHFIDQDSEKQGENLAPGEISKFSPTPFRSAEETIKKQTFRDVDIDKLRNKADNVYEIFKPLEYKNEIRSENKIINEEDTVEQSLKEGRSELVDISVRKSNHENNLKTGQSNLKYDKLKMARKSVERIIQKSNSSTKHEPDIKTERQKNIMTKDENSIMTKNLGMRFKKQKPEITETLEQQLKDGNASSATVSSTAKKIKGHTTKK